MKRIFHISAFILVISSVILMAGCGKKTDDITQESPKVLQVTIPKPAPEEVKITEEDAIIEDTKEEISASDKDALKIAEELNIMWGPEEDKKNQKSSEKTPKEDQWSNAWRSMTEEELTAIEEAKKDSETEDHPAPTEEEKTNTEENSEEIIPADKETKIPKEDATEDKTEENSVEEEKKTEKKPEEIPPSETEAKSEEQQILEIVAKINKYTSIKSQEKILEEELLLIENTDENLSLLLDIKSFLPKSFHDSINEKIANIIAEERADI